MPEYFRQEVRTRSRQAGMSLIEIMIALVIGLIVVSAVLNVYVGSARSSSFSDGLRAVQENGRYGIGSLQRGLRLAGYAPGTFFHPVDIVNSSATSISVRMVADYDCNGIDTAPVGGVAVNTYSFDAATNEIRCRGNSATPVDMPLIEGIEAFRVMYGMDMDDDGDADMYKSWAVDLEPSRVRALRIAFLASSVRAIRTRAVAEKHLILDQELETDDRIARHVFSTTILLRNGVNI